MRIIGGTARGRGLVAPKGLSTRPTGARAREALFNILSHRLSGASVLDAFAGSGALGLEALSRGAKDCLFIDCDRAAQKAIAANARACGFEQEIWCMDTCVAMQRLAAQGRRFDVIFLDPPYGTGLLEQALGLAVALLAPGALIVAEDSRQSSAIQKDGLVLTDERRYGENVLRFYAAQRKEG
nr:16S rRNA (guanine(966)-N(2))-methyltransferase RsmD [bacterium]